MVIFSMCWIIYIYSNIDEVNAFQFHHRKWNYDIYEIFPDLYLIQNASITCMYFSWFFIYMYHML